MHQIVVALGWVLAVAATAIALPQFVHVLRTGRDEGVSLRTCALAAASTFAWVGYTVGLRDVPAIASSVGPMLAWLSCGVLVAHRRRTLLRFGVELAVLFSTVALAGTLLGVFHVLAVSGSLLWVLPQVLVTRRQRDLSGVSVPAYVLLAAENIGWVLYAWGTRTPAYALAPLVQGPLAVFIAIHARRAHRATTSSLGGTGSALPGITTHVEPNGGDSADAVLAPSASTAAAPGTYDELVGKTALDCQRS